jgi:hypothetical protein
MQPPRLAAAYDPAARHATSPGDPPNTSQRGPSRRLGHARPLRMCRATVIHGEAMRYPKACCAPEPTAHRYAAEHDSMARGDLP